MSLTAAERETTLVISDDAKEWLVSSYRRADITKLKKNPDLVIDEEGTFEGTPYLIGRLPMGGITIRSTTGRSGKSKTRKSTKREMPANAPRCKGTKLNGSPCGALANAETGFCARHKDQA